MSSEEVAEFYNNLAGQNVEERKFSRIVYLRSFNNWIKSMMIQEACETMKDPTEASILDLCCGKGGDMFKWQRADVSEVLFVDIAQKSMEECQDRYYKSRTKNSGYPQFGVHFIVMDVTEDDLVQKLPRKMQCEVVSCQFALHYAFRSEKHLRRVLWNVSNCLKTGGEFIGTIADGEKIVSYLRRTPNGIFQNEVVKIEYLEPNITNWANLTPPLFGAKILFNLDTQVNCPEYLAYLPLLEEIAKEFKLELKVMCTFPEAIERYNKIDQRVLLSKMKALEEYPVEDDRLSNVRETLVGHKKFKEEYEHVEKERKKILSSGDRKIQSCIGTLSKSEWETINMYSMFIFRKKA
uniref:mRNA cap guanine-N7 methyltransferase n=1 Tax=Panagrolaimus sp. JU765 TaxID=591449 RepID=A0AC34QID7_9BILA